MAAKVIYYYGTVNSSKTMMLLAIGHNYESAGFNVIAIKPALDTRSELIETRAHIPPRKPDIVLQLDESIYDYKDIINDADVILVDECQFLSENQIGELRNLSIKNNIDILCFGLRTDSNAKLFPAAKRLFELADEIIEVKTICQICGKHASFNKKVVYSKNDSGNIDPGWDNFQAVCYQHFLD
jgi:thymidine kinase